MADAESKFIGERMRHYRQERGLTLKELASRLNMHFTTVGRMENGKHNFTFEKLNAIAEALNVNFDWLTGDKYYDIGIIDVPIYNKIEANDDRHPRHYSREYARLPVIQRDGRNLDDCYAIATFNDISTDPFHYGFWYFAVDPNARNIVRGGLYAIYFAGEANETFATFDLGGPSITVWPSGQKEPLGARAFKILGQVFYQAREIRNDPDLDDDAWLLPDAPKAAPPKK